MLTEAERRQAAESLFRAERELKAIPQLSKTYPSIELADSYSIQRMYAELHIANGSRQIGQVLEAAP